MTVCEGGYRPMGESMVEGPRFFAVDNVIWTTTQLPHSLGDMAAVKGFLREFHG